MPARLVYGYLFGSATLGAHMWVEFRDESGAWRPIDPQNFTGKFDPVGYFPLAVPPNDSYRADDYGFRWSANAKLTPVVLETMATK